MSDTKTLYEFIFNLAVNPQLQEQMHQVYTQNGSSGLKEYLQSQGLSEQDATLLAEAQTPVSGLTQQDTTSAKQKLIDALNEAAPSQVWVVGVSADST